MGAILKNIEFKGCTMGSLAEFKRAIAFIEMHKIKPVVHTILSGLEHADVGFDLMKSGGQFGKVRTRPTLLSLGQHFCMF